MIKTCQNCGNQFDARGKAKYCDKCADAYQKLYYLKYRDKRRANSKSYYQKLKQDAANYKFLKEALQ